MFKGDSPPVAPTSHVRKHTFTRGNDDAEESNYCRLKKNNNAPLMTQMKPNLRVAALWR